MAQKRIFGIFRYHRGQGCQIFQLLMKWQMSVMLLVLISSNVWGRDDAGFDTASSGHYTSSMMESSVAVESENVYQLEQLRNLRRPVPPRRIVLLDWKNYVGSGQVYREGILFTYRDLNAEHVFLAGDFSGWQRLYMERNRFGIFYAMIPVRQIESGQRVQQYLYRFNIDGLWTHDPLQYSKEDGSGGLMSVFYLENEPPNRLAGPRILREKRQGDLRLVEFAVHESKLLSRARLSRVENVSIVGDFNHWNPESDLLHKGNDGVYRIRMKLLPGKYLYRIVVDGRWIIDPFNEKVSFHSGLNDSYSEFDVK